MNEQENEKLLYIIYLLRSSNGIFDITLGPEECSLLIKYILFKRRKVNETL